jgi:hypothetical protein
MNRHNGKLEKHNRIATVFYTNSLLKIHLASREKHHIFLKHLGLPMSPRLARKALGETHREMSGAQIFTALIMIWVRRPGNGRKYARKIFMIMRNSERLCLSEKVF